MPRIIPKQQQQVQPKQKQTRTINVAQQALNEPSTDEQASKNLQASSSSKSTEDNKASNMDKGYQKKSGKGGGMLDLLAAIRNPDNIAKLRGASKQKAKGICSMLFV